MKIWHSPLKFGSKGLSETQLLRVELSVSLKLCACRISLVEAVLLGGAGPAQFSLQFPDLLLKLGAQVGLIGCFNMIQSLLGCCLGLEHKQTQSDEITVYDILFNMGIATKGFMNLYTTYISEHIEEIHLVSNLSHHFILRFLHYNINTKKQNKTEKQNSYLQEEVDLL